MICDGADPTQDTLTGALIVAEGERSHGSRGTLDLEALGATFERGPEMDGH